MNNNHCSIDSDDNAYFLGSISKSSQTWDHKRKQTRSSASVRSKSKHSHNQPSKHDIRNTLRQHRDKFLTNVIRIKQSIPCMSKHKNRGDRQRVHYTTKIKRIYRQSKKAVEKLSHMLATNRSTEANDIPPYYYSI